MVPLARYGLVVALLVLTAAATLHANGAAFFRPASATAEVDLMYFGSIRDTGGRPLDYVDVTVRVRDGSLTYPFANDAPGHYRSPDVGLLIKEAGELVDPRRLEVTCYAEGFRTAVRSVPRRTRGAYEVNCTLEPILPDSPELADASAYPNTLDARDDSPSAGGFLPAESAKRRNRSNSVPAVGLIVLALTATAARTAARRTSTTHSNRV
jgi:hypothetical protein